MARASRTTTDRCRHDNAGRVGRSLSQCFPQTQVPAATIVFRPVLRHADFAHPVRSRRCAQPECDIMGGFRICHTWMAIDVVRVDVRLGEHIWFMTGPDFIKIDI